MKEIRLVLPSFDVDKFVDFPEFCSFISPNHCFCIYIIGYNL